MKSSSRNVMKGVACFVTGAVVVTVVKLAWAWGLG